MKVGYFADGPWSHEAIELLVDKVDLVFIVPRYDTQDPVLKEWAEKLGIPYYPVANVNTKEFIEWLSSFDADLFISMSFNQILKKEILKASKKGFINCHAGALPFYRGRNPLNWVLINGEKEFGITVHYIDEGIDTGDIILQKKYEIKNHDDYSTLLDKAIQECALLLAESVELIEKNNDKVISQSSIHPVGTYYGRRIVGDELINFSWSAKRLFDFVRAITLPGPGARCNTPQGEIAVLECELIADAPTYIATEGEVVGIKDSGVVVKVGDSTILITKYTEINNEELKIVKKPSFKIGTRLRGK